MSDQDNHGVCPTRCFKERSNVMTRIFLFVGTNLAILFILNISLRVLGVDTVLETQGGGINVTALLVISAVFGMGGSFISLAISKWMAKRSTGARVIERPGNRTERWLLDTVARQARQAGIGMPEGGDLRRARDQRIRDGHEPQQRARCGEHGVAGQHVGRRG